MYSVKKIHLVELFTISFLKIANFISNDVGLRGGGGGGVDFWSSRGTASPGCVFACSSGVTELFFGDDTGTFGWPELERDDDDAFELDDDKFTEYVDSFLSVEQQKVD